VRLRRAGNFLLKKVSRAERTEYGFHLRIQKQLQLLEFALKIGAQDSEGETGGGVTIRSPRRPVSASGCTDTDSEPGPRPGTLTDAHAVLLVHVRDQPALLTRA